MSAAASAYRLEDLPAEMRELISVHPETGCWIWQGSITIDGYGTYRSTGVHRTAYKLLVAPIPPSLVIDHVRERGCRSRACCWPVHLEAITRAENTRRGCLTPRQQIPQPYRTAAQKMQRNPPRRIVRDKQKEVGL